MKFENKKQKTKQNKTKQNKTNKQNKKQKQTQINKRKQNLTMIHQKQTNKGANIPVTKPRKLRERLALSFAKFVQIPPDKGRII